MEGQWRQLLSQYGQRVVLCKDDGEKEVRAFFQPVRERAAGQAPTPLGIAPAGQYLYLGPAEETLEQVRELKWADRSFRVIRRRQVPLGERDTYCWALAEEMDEVEQ